MVTKFSTSYLQISVEPKKKCLIQSWIGYCTSEEFRYGQQRSLDIFIEEGCQNFISDTTDAIPLPEEDVVWVSEVITPKLHKAGMEILNLVVPSSVFTRLTLEMLEKTDGEINQTPLRFFGSLECALESI